MYSNFVQQRIHIPFYSNLQITSLGMDSVEHCRNRKVFSQYPEVTYQFNELGFRTHNVNCFDTNAILVLGDSFTLGLGVNSKDRYSDIIEKTLNHQVLNFSLNGASNDWISRKLEQLLKYFTPRAIILHYTFSHRRERPNSDWFDDERTECEPFYSSQQNFDNWLKNFNSISGMYQGPTIHSFIPNWHDQLVNYTNLGDNVLAPVLQIDQARDNFHYGTKTHHVLAEKIINLLA